MLEYNCRVCGITLDESPWGADGKTPTYEICVCCGVEFGYEDYTLESIRQYRSEWLKNGAKWFEPKYKLFNWDLDKQLTQIPEDYW